MLRIRERGGHHDSPSKICCLNTEKLRRGNLCFRKVLVSQNFKDERGRKGVSRFYVGNFLSHSAENFCRGTLLCCRKFLVSKNVKKREREGGASRLSLKNLLSHRTEQLRRGNLCFRKFWYRKMLRIREREGASRLSIETLLSHSTEKLRTGNLCFRKFLVSKNVKDKRERGHHDFPSKLCCLTVPKIFVGETCVSESFCYRKMLRIREGGGITTFHRNIVVSQYRKTSQGKLVFQKISGIEKC